jgi:hypothetical protein
VRDILGVASGSVDYRRLCRDQLATLLMPPEDVVPAYGTRTNWGLGQVGFAITRSDDAGSSAMGDARQGPRR